MMVSMKLGSKSGVFQREGQAWICKTGLPSDIVVEVGEISFHLHKFPLLSRSGVLENLIENFHSEEGSMCTLQLYDIPGGAKSFELVAKFCYGVKIELTSSNIVALRCAAEHLRMTEDYGEANLIAQTEVFLNEVFCSWKDSIKALETCEEVLPHAEELHIVSRCINSLAMKACADPALFGWPVTTGKGPSRSTPNKSGVLWNGIGGATGKGNNVNEGWWYEDVSVLNLSLYKRLILAVELSGMAPENIAGSLIYYAKGHLPGLSRRSSFQEGTSRAPPSSSSAPESNENEHMTLLEEIVELMPMKKGVTSTRHLLGLLRSAILLHASSQCRESLEKRIGAQLDEAALEDLLIPNLGCSLETLYETDCVQRILDYFLSADQTANANSPSILDEGQLIGSPSLTPMTTVAKLVDGYLAEVAPDANLKLPKFQSLAALIPDFARPLDDGIYRAIDIYLKAHPWLTDSEREQLCRLMNCQKLSMEACTHAAQNERLPLRVVVQVLFFEQLRLRTSIAGWFFVSDSHDNPRGNLGLSSNGISEQAGLALDGKEDPLTGGMEDMKVRVKELEKECMDMRQEIEKLCKPKSSWSLLSKLGFGGKKKYSRIEKEETANEKE